MAFLIIPTNEQITPSSIINHYHVVPCDSSDTLKLIMKEHNIQGQIFSITYEQMCKLKGPFIWRSIF